MVNAMAKGLRSRRNRPPLLCSYEEIKAAVRYPCGRKFEREFKVSAEEEARLLSYKEEVRERIMKKIRSLKMKE